MIAKRARAQKTVGWSATLKYITRYSSVGQAERRQMSAGRISCARACAYGRSSHALTCVSTAVQRACWCTEKHVGNALFTRTSGERLRNIQESPPKALVGVCAAKNLRTFKGHTVWAVYPAEFEFIVVRVRYAYIKSRAVF